MSALTARNSALSHPSIAFGRQGVIERRKPTIGIDTPKQFSKSPSLIGVTAGHEERNGLPETRSGVSDTRQVNAIG